MEDQKILFVVNPISGGLEKHKFISDLEKISQELKFKYRNILTTGKNDQERIIKAIKDYDPDVVGVAGGDGTVNLVARVLVDLEVPLGIIPFGSANGMALELNIPQNTYQAILILVKGKEKKVDTLRINDTHTCLHISDLGLNANIIKRFDKDKIRGMIGYVKQFIRELKEDNIIKASINIDNDIIRYKAIMVVMANASKYGTGAIINPDGKIDDRRFEVCVVKPYSFIALLRIIPWLLRGKVKEMGFVDVLSCTSVSIRCQESQRLQIDGEYIDDVKEVRAVINPASLNIKVPDS